MISWIPETTSARERSSQSLSSYKMRKYCLSDVAFCHVSVIVPRNMPSVNCLAMRSPTSVVRTFSVFVSVSSIVGGENSVS